MKKGRTCTSSPAFAPTSPSRSDLGGPIGGGAEQHLREPGDGHDETAADDVEPQVADVAEEEEGDDGRLGDRGADQHRRGGDAAEEERDQEQAEHRAVEDRAEDVHGLDQVVEQRCEAREGEGDEAPHGREGLGRDEGVLLRGAGVEAAAVQVDHRGRPEGVELAGRATHGRRHDHGDQQAHQPAGKVLKDEAHEDVVAVLGLRVGQGGGDQGLGVGFFGGELSVGGSHGCFRDEIFGARV